MDVPPNPLESHAMGRIRHLVRPTTASLLLTAALSAQSGGFQPGDLYFYTPGNVAGASSSGAIVRVQPTTGAVTVLHDLVTTISTADQMAYDPWRDRLIFFGGFTPNHNEVYLTDAAGNLQSLGFGVASGPVTGQFAPRGDGILYFRHTGAPTLISYLDAANQVHTLMDASGAAPYSFPFGAGAIRNLEYFAATNSLVAVTSNGLATCSGGVFDALNIRRLDLSADGSRVVAETCYQHDMDPGGFPEVPVDLAPGPNGSLLLSIDNNDGSVQPHIALVSPGSETSSPFAWFGSGSVGAGCYSQVLGRAVYFDSFTNELRTVGFGGTGAGALLSSNVSGVGGAGEIATLVEIVSGTGGFGMTGTPGSISLAAGGSQSWSVDFGAAHAGELHLALGSLSGWTPGFVLDGALVSLQPDTYFTWTLTHQNSGVLPGSLGTLDGQGQASAAFVVPAGSNPALAGLVAYHAMVAVSGSSVTAATNPVPVALLP